MLFTGGTTALSLCDSLVPTTQAGREHGGALLGELHSLASELLTRFRLKYAASASAI